MNAFFEWTLAVHRAMWFPLFWALGLERRAIDFPLEIPTALAAEQRIAMPLTPPAQPGSERSATSAKARRLT